MTYATSDVSYPVKRLKVHHQRIKHEIKAYLNEPIHHLQLRGAK